MSKENIALPRILLVEDEQKVAEYIKLGIEENGYEVDVAFDGFIGQRMFNNNSYNLLLLDINVPQINGYELTKYVRDRNAIVPIILLTALSSTEDKVRGFEVGADDYVVKPYDLRELMARIKTHITRSQIIGAHEQVIKIDDLEVNAESKIVRRGSKKIELTNKEFSLLLYLLKNQGKVVTRQQIAEEIWGIKFERNTNVIDVYVNFLRKKIDKDFPRKLINTQIGKGYCIMPTDSN